METEGTNKSFFLGVADKMIESKFLVKGLPRMASLYEAGCLLGVRKCNSDVVTEPKGQVIPFFRSANLESDPITLMQVVLAHLSNFIAVN